MRSKFGFEPRDDQDTRRAERARTERNRGLAFTQALQTMEPRVLALLEEIRADYDAVKRTRTLLDRQHDVQYATTHWVLRDSQNQQPVATVVLAPTILPTTYDPQRPPQPLLKLIVSSYLSPQDTAAFRTALGQLGLPIDDERQEIMT